MIYRLVNATLIRLTKVISLFLPIRGKVLMFHGVGDEDIENFNISIEEFQTVIDAVKHTTCVHACEVLDKNHFVSITFDDVRASFYGNAYPILRQNNIPFTLFIATDLIGREGYLSELQIKELGNDPLCEIGSHSIRHCKYRYLSRTEQEEELKESKNKLSGLVGHEIKTFAFPYGSITACGLTHKRLVKKYYNLGFSTIGIGFTRPLLLPLYFLPRINVDGKYVERIRKQMISNK